MGGSYSSDSLLSFLKDVVVAGHLPAATARSRSQATRALMAYLTDGENSDLRILDLEALRARLAEDQGGALRPEVAELYVERFRCALADFLPFAEAPSDFTSGKEGEPAPLVKPGAKTGVKPETRPGAETGSETRFESTAAPEDRRALESARLRFDRNRSDIVPIPLPRGSTVYVHGLPADLSLAEAQKITRVIRALADDGDAES